MNEQLRTGLDYVNAATDLLQRLEGDYPGRGLYQAAEIQFWWSRPRSTDSVEQLFWFDDDGRPGAAMFVNDFGDGSSLLYDDPTVVVVVMPDSPADWVAHVVDRGLARVAELDIESVELEIGQADDVMRQVMFDRGFEIKGDGLVECWLDVSARPEVSPLADGYRLLARSDMTDRPHHMSRPDRPGPEPRLQQVSIYRPELDLVVVDAQGEPAAHGIFWHDPVTATGVVEPMRTLDEHQQRGLARHILTAGINRLADAGAKRISIGYEPDNPASGHLYRSVGFVPHSQSDLFAGPVVSS